MIKLISTDLDGTFLTETGMPSPESIAAMELAINRGIMFVVSSGRFYNSINTIFKDYDKNDNMIFVSHNGAWVQEAKDGKILSKTLLRKDEYREFIKFLQKNCPEAKIYLGERDAAIIEATDEDTLNELDKMGIPAKIIDDLLTYEGYVIRAGAYFDNGVPKEIFQEAKERFSGIFDVTMSGDHWLDIMGKGINKGNGIKIIQELYGISKEETMVFGDHYNDIEMFSRAHYSFAMGHAPEEVRKHANFTAEANLERGVANEILKACV